MGNVRDVNPLQVGDLLDHYRIGQVAARGGMATVYRATDIETGAHVAIKVPHPEAESDVVFFDRFQREAEIGRELDHPGVVKVLPKERQSRVYMVLEWCEGRLLREMLSSDGAFAPDRAVRIALAICDALEYIHDNGIVHRDLKPENIMVGEDDQIKLLDFGIAAKEGARRLTFGKLSHTMGTADYIAPEQVKGKRGDARSDIYALGAILYEMVAGEPPFHGANPFAVMNARLVADPEPVRELNPEVSPELETIIARAMERSPERRYLTARELAFDLLHPTQMRVMEPPRKTEVSSKRLLLYSGLAAIPCSILGLLLYVAEHQ
jgi:serine/threonine protein kinase